MKQQSKLLKVMSILMIIFGILGTIGTFASTFLMQTVMQNPQMQAAYEAAGVPQISNGLYVVSILVAVMEVIAGIVGVMYRSKKSVLIAGSIWVVLILANLIWSMTITGFQFTFIFSLNFPILYFWGWYQSN